MLVGLGDREGVETSIRMLRRDPADHLHAAAVGHVHVQQNHVGACLADPAYGLLDGRRVADDLDQVLELRPHPRPEDLVIVDDHDPGARHSSTSSTSVPEPGALVMFALPPLRSMRPTIDSRMPRRSVGIAAGSKPGPRSLTKTRAPPS